MVMSMALPGTHDAAMGRCKPPTTRIQHRLKTYIAQVAGKTIILSEKETKDTDDDLQSDFGYTASAETATGVAELWQRTMALTKRHLSPLTLKADG